jgi:methionyl-tRNA formyltransferase
MRGKPLRITVLVDNLRSWYCPHAERLVEALREDHQVVYVHDSTAIPEGDCAFLLSCSRLIRPDVLARNRHNVVVHSSRLPEGRGFAPLSWQILAGRSIITNTMFEAAESVDSGHVYGTNEMHFEGHELVDELRTKQAAKIAELVRAFVKDYPNVAARPQVGNPTSYPRRRNRDSQLDVHKSIAEQFDLFRVVDNDSYPAFFHYRGFRYVLKIHKDGPVAEDHISQQTGESQSAGKVKPELTELFPLEDCRA